MAAAIPCRWQQRGSIFSKGSLSISEITFSRSPPPLDLPCIPLARRGGHMVRTSQSLQRECHWFGPVLSDPLKGSVTQMNTNKIILEFRKQGGRWMTLDRQTGVSATPSACLKKGWMLGTVFPTSAASFPAPNNLWLEPLWRITGKPAAFYSFYSAVWPLVFPQGTSKLSTGVQIQPWIRLLRKLKEGQCYK